MSGYNGWTNYPTWRVNLEVFDGGNWDRYTPKDMEEFVRDLLTADVHTGLVVDYAMSFISEVNWHEIHSHYVEESTIDEDE